MLKKYQKLHNYFVNNSFLLFSSFFYAATIYLANLYFINYSSLKETNFFYILLAYLSLYLGLTSFGLSQLFLYKGLDLKIPNFFNILKTQLLIILIFLPIPFIYLPDIFKLEKIFYIFLFLISQRLHDIGYVYSIQRLKTSFVYKYFYLFKAIVFIFTFLILSKIFSFSLVDTMLLSFSISNLFVFFIAFRKYLNQFFLMINFREILSYKKRNLFYLGVSSYIEIVLSSTLIFISYVYNNHEILYIYIVSTRILSPLNNLNTFLASKYTKEIINRTGDIYLYLKEYILLGLLFLILSFFVIYISDFIDKKNIISINIFLFFSFSVLFHQFLTFYSSWIITKIIFQKKIFSDLIIKIITLFITLLLCIILKHTQDYLFISLLVLSIPLTRIIYYVCFLRNKI